MAVTSSNVVLFCYLSSAIGAIVAISTTSPMNRLVATPLIFIVLILFGCSGEAATSLRLFVEYPGDWGLTDLRVDMAEDNRMTEVLATDELLVLVADELANVPLTIELTGLKSGVALANGSARVVPLHHQEVTARITLALSACDTSCEPGNKQCRNDGVVTCQAPDSDGCPSWSEAVACGEDAPFCSDGTCAAACTDECTLGETRCDGTSRIQLCGQGDSDSCTDWSEPVLCELGQCSNGRCEAIKGSCTGTAQSCTDAGTDASLCNRQTGCSWSEVTCALASDCEGAATSSECRNLPGCQTDVTGTNGTWCKPVPNYCSDPGPDDCESVAGCESVSGCSGNAVACDTLVAEEPCTAQTGCLWQ